MAMVTSNSRVFSSAGQMMIHKMNGLGGHLIWPQQSYLQFQLDRVQKIVLLGRPATGKGTFGEKLALQLNVPHISTGDLIREELKKASSALAHRISGLVNTGRLIPDEIVMELLSNKLEGGSMRSNGFILDGFPRNLKQAKELQSVTDVDVALNLNLSEDALVKKCLGRRVCTDCGKIFSLVNVEVDGVIMPAMLPPKECSKKLEAREDDREDSIRQRLKVYEEESKPVVDFYRKQGKLVEFDVVGSVEKNWPRLVDALKLESSIRSSSSAAASEVVAEPSCGKQVLEA